MPIRGDNTPVDPIVLPIWAALQACEAATEDEDLLEKIGEAYDALLATNRKLYEQREDR